MTFFQLAIVAFLIAYVSAEVTVLTAVQTLYSRSPKLRIKGTGFDADEHHIFMELGAPGDPSLKLDKDYLITKDDEGLILKLLSNRKWVDMKDRKPPVALVLSAVRLNDPNGDNLLREQVILANVLQTPTVKDNDQLVYMTATNELRIGGNGFAGAKKVDLYFNPPIYKEIAYEVVSKFPLASDEIVLRLRHGYEWRDEPGPIAVIGIDTGGGPVKTNGETGVRVAEVQADLDVHGVTVEDTYLEQVIYHDASSVYIRGEGFNTLGTVFRFANGLLGKGVNYTVSQLTETSANLRLTPGSHWRRNTQSLPGFLTLLAVNAGEGFVAVGATNAKKGRDIARVFERPAVYSANTKLFRTHSHELHIFGEGFPRTMTKPKLTFSPELVEGSDYDVTVLDRTEMVIHLKDNRQWASTPGALLVTKINTRGDGDGWVDLPGDGVHVAEIIEDVDSVETGGVQVSPSSTRVYQSMMQDTITINGKGFTSGSVSLVFEPPIKDGVDFDLDVASSTQIIMRLRRGKKWAPSPQALIAKSVTLQGKSYPLANGDGIRVANVLADPSVDSGRDSYHETQSKVVAIYGQGFTNAADISLELRPTAPESYKILGVSEDTIRVQLKEGYDWLPSHLNLDESPDDTKIPLEVMALNTGAGRLAFDSPVTIGLIVKDREGVVCDDSCEFAFDGVCDDGTADESYYYFEEDYAGYSYGGFYMDDDLGGYYNDELRMGEFYYSEGELIDDDYYMENDEYMVSACVEGTDCTDCGGVDAIIDWSSLALEEDSKITVCSNTCIYARDGVCDDPRGADYCKIGTDCQDCGPVGQDNFTSTVDDDWWDDDDDYWAFNDGNFLEQIKGPTANAHKIKKFREPVPPQTTSTAAVFITVLEGMVYTVGCVFALLGGYLVYRWYHGMSLPFMHVFSPEMMNTEEQFAKAPTKKMAITPDVIRT